MIVFPVKLKKSLLMQEYTVSGFKKNHELPSDRSFILSLSKDEFYYHVMLTLRQAQGELGIALEKICIVGVNMRSTEKGVGRNY